jgi:hypothetical protein
MPLPTLLFLLLSPCLLPAQSEADYCRGLAAALDGTTEVPVTSGRVDVLTATHAIETGRISGKKASARPSGTGCRRISGRASS